MNAWFFSRKVLEVKPFHPAVFLEREWKQRYLVIPASKMGGKFAAEGADF